MENRTYIAKYTGILSSMPVATQIDSDVDQYRIERRGEKITLEAEKAPGA